jgi:hypothetical protein
VCGTTNLVFNFGWEEGTTVDINLLMESSAKPRRKRNQRNRPAEQAMVQ